MVGTFGRMLVLRAVVTPIGLILPSLMRATLLTMVSV
jgi:hypothetical protein